MKILAIDIGTGTQDILLFDSRLDVENSLKLVLPSPTLMISKKLNRARRDKVDVLLTGRLMGGGPNNWAALDHIRSGNRVYVTPEAALSFNDDLEVVRESGIEVISTDEAHDLPDSVRRVDMRDFDFDAIATILRNFEVDLSDLGAIAVAVFDHGNAPFDVSDRKFRFDYLDARIREKNSLSAFAYLTEDIPSIMTRLRSVADGAGGLPAPLVVMDTAPAAVLGALYDPLVASRDQNLVLNIGNLHTLGFRVGSQGIEGVFEHHTGMLDRMHLEEILMQFADGSLTNEEVFNHHGHGALIYSHAAYPLDREDFNLVVTGPRRSLIQGSPLKPYFAVPFGDMMVAGCVGLIAATMDVIPALKAQIEPVLTQSATPKSSPWELDR